MSTPSSIGRCRILSWLGRGSVGVAFAAHDEGLGCDLAIKISPREGPS